MKDPAKRQVSEPALFYTVQNILPLVTTVMFAFTAGMIAIVATRSNPNSQVDEIPFLHLSIPDLSLIPLVIASLLFLFASEACAKSVAWDYYSLSEERRKASDLEDDEIYINYCVRQSEYWYVVAVWIYRIGRLLLLLGVAVLLIPLSYTASIALLVCYVVLEIGLRYISPR